MYTAPTQNKSQRRKIKTIRRKKDWQKLLTEYAVSHLSQKAFCELHQLSMSSFYQWKKKLSQETSVEANFIDISPQVENDYLGTTALTEPPSYQVELELGFGIVLRVRNV